LGLVLVALVRDRFSAHQNFLFYSVPPFIIRYHLTVRFLDQILTSVSKTVSLKQSLQYDQLLQAIDQEMTLFTDDRESDTNSQAQNHTGKIRKLSASGLHKKVRSVERLAKCASRARNPFVLEGYLKFSESMRSLNRGLKWVEGVNDIETFRLRKSQE
jgi:hypothetical protein